MEGEGSSEMEYTDIETVSESFDTSVIYHVVKDVLGFILYMHEQIPSVLQDISLEFDGLNTEYKELETVLKQETKLSSRRTQAGRMREVKHGIRRLEKLMNNVSYTQNALQEIVKEIPDIQGVIMVLGGSPVRPQHVYELCFSHGKAVPSCDFAKNRTGEGLSKKAIRALISKGAGSSSYSGQSKLFLLVKAPSTFSMPQHFLPKRDFKYSKKIVPMRLRFNCKTSASNHGSETANPDVLTHPNSTEFIWFQCRHVIKGLACKPPSPEE